MGDRRIRPIAICLFCKGDLILVEEHPDTVKQDWFCRPVGGGIDFGEHSAAAIVREVGEELGAEIERIELVGVLENIFTCEGEPGHEVVFVYNASFTDKSLYDLDAIQGYEHGNGSHFTARWRSLKQIRRDGARLVPEGLAELLEELGQK
jgi:8-oxo-dGTP pyrophosphatase MutT (NUDIX family)